MSDTIFALSTAHGRAGIAVVRVSGDLALRSASDLTHNDFAAKDRDHSMLLCKIICPQSRDMIDEGLVLSFQNPRSYTGEDVVEYHIHGGKAIIDKLLHVLAAQPGHRMAEPGEFTRRAFENGKMDLTQAEAVADLIDAETEYQRMQAVDQMGGSLSDLYYGWRDDLTNHLAYIEADLEFPDEDLPDGIERDVKPKVRDLIAALAAHLSDDRRGERMRDGVQVVIIGPPNAGKSSLLNALARRDVAIVSDTPGTTRDALEAHLDLGGYPVVLVDTAGLRPEHIGAQGHDKIENEGMKRALARAEEADLKILVFDGMEKQADQETLSLKDENTILVINKGDQDVCLALHGALTVSAQTEVGFAALLAELRDKIEARFTWNNHNAPALTRQRHRFALEDVRGFLERSLSADLPELMAEDVRLAIRSLGKITGAVDVEDLLDVIFNDFCIGK